MRTVAGRIGAVLGVVALVLLGTELTTLSRSGEGVVVVHDEASFRAAVAQLSSSAGPVTIALADDIVLDDGTTPAFTGTWALTIDGGGHTIDARGTSGVLVTGEGRVSITDLEVTGGVDGTIVSGYQNVIVVERSFFHHNTGDVFRMGLHADIELRSSTFALNDGVVVHGSNPYAENSTFSGNTGTALVAGSDQYGTFGAEVLHTTFVGNGGNVSAGGLISTASVFGPTSDGSPACDLADIQPVLGTTSSHSWAADDSCLFDDPTDVVGGDPELEALADFGGPTPTQPPQRFSPLVDAIPAAECAVATDQRGEPRPQGFGCDVGAVELAETSGGGSPSSPSSTTVPEGPAPTTSTPTTTMAPVLPPPPGVPSSSSDGGPVSGSPTYAG